MTWWVGDLEEHRRRWNAAVLQRYLRQRAQAGISARADGIESAAEEIRAELLPESASGDPLHQAWVDLVVMGLVVVNPLPTGDSLWRLADFPRDPVAAGVGAGT